MVERFENKPEQVLLICTSCNDFGLISQEACNKLLKESGKLETICPHCGGTMILPHDSTSLREANPRFFSNN